jgi:Helix-turn-helix domain
MIKPGKEIQIRHQVRGAEDPRGSLVASFVGVMATRDAPTRALLTRAELAEVLRVSLSTIDRLRRRGVIRPVQLVPNGRVAYRVEDVDALLDAPRELHLTDPSELIWR